MTEEEKIAWIQLALTPSIGPITFKHLIKQFKTAQNTVKQLPEYAKFSGRRKNITIVERDRAEKYIQQCAEKKIHLICSFESNYPKSLTRINSTPPILHTIGNISLLNHQSCVAIIGSRNASIQGKAFTTKLAQELSNHGVCIVSGLARGIDAAAHRGGLNSTIAVMANGINIIYPQENKELYEKISQTGLIISEEILDKEPRPEAFTYRNRIISGLSECVIIIEAALKSGSLITAEYAAQQGKDIFAVPGHPYDFRSAGTNYLLKNGALLLEKAEDVIQYLTTRQNARTQTKSTQSQQKLEELFEMPETERIDGINDNITTEDVYDEDHIKCAKEYLRHNLSSAPIDIDTIITASNFSASEINGAIAQLELSEEIVITGNKIFVNKR
jgi:DNA processing protein